MIEVEPERFEEMVAEALDGLPQELGELMSNVAVVVEHRKGPRGLLGLYRGIPLTRRTTAYSGVLRRPTLTGGQARRLASTLLLPSLIRVSE